MHKVTTRKRQDRDANANVGLKTQNSEQSARTKQQRVGL